MSDILDNFKQVSEVKRAAQNWLSLIGKVGYGGGEHVGRFSTVQKYCVKECEILYQKSTGSNNYHSIPDTFKVYVERAIQNNIEMLVNEAMEHLDKHVKEAGIKAKQEYERIAKEIGLEL